MLKPPVNIDNLMKEWSEDIDIRPDDMQKELLKISFLHAKYLNIMSYHRHLLRKIEADYKLMKGLREDYYHGYLNNKEDLTKYGWEPMELNLSNPQIAHKLETDGELNKLLLKRIAHEEIVSYCESVLKSLHNRTWDLGNFVKYLIHTQGK